MINNDCIKFLFFISSNFDKIPFNRIGSLLTNFEIPQIPDINILSTILVSLEIYTSIVSSYIISTIGQQPDRQVDDE